MKSTPRIKYLEKMVILIFNFFSEVLARATTVRDSLEHLKAGTVLWKLRDKGSIMGLKLYRRKYRLNMADLMISYTPNKGMQNSCVGASNGKFARLPKRQTKVVKMPNKNWIIFSPNKEK
jgi:hypothetical protein